MSIRSKTGSLLLVAGLAACAPGAQAPSPSAVETKVYDISCDDAHRVAARTLRIRELKITSVNRSASGGSVRGKSEKEEIEVQLVCGAQGVTVSSTGGLWLEQGIRMSFASFVSQGDRIWPVPRGPKILVEQLPGVEAKLEFPQELESLGMTAVHLRALNGGTRALRIDPRRISGRRESGPGARAISAEGVRSKLGGIDPDLDRKILQATTLKQGDEVRGFIFFPAAVYDSVVVMLADVETGEADEFEIFFSN